MTWALKSLKNFHFNSLFLSNVYIVWAKKTTEELSFMKLNRNTKFGEESTCRFKIDIYKEFDKFWSEHSKVTKIFTLMGSFWAKYILFELKSTEELSLITLKKYAKFEEKLTCRLGNDMRNLTNFHQSTWKCQNSDFDGILLSKVEKVWPQNLQRSYVSWQWTIQNFTRNWIVISKLTWVLIEFWLEHSKI